jgi:2,5-diamino-6-(ribosylamino)-4(3H)-pyrimidinone 5'-phosphate reductase
VSRKRWTDEGGQLAYTVCGMSPQNVIGRPRVIVSSTASIDGRITFSRHERLLDPDVGRRWQSLWPPDVPELIEQRAGHIEERHHPTVELEGSGTFVPDIAAEVAGIPGQHDPARLRRDWLPKQSPKWFVVVDSRGRVPWSFTGNADVSLLVLACDRTPLSYLAWLRELGVPYLVAGSEKVNLPLVLAKMRVLLSTACVVSEGGGGTNGGLLRQGLVDELQMIWFPAVIGGADTPSSFDGDALMPGEAPCAMNHRATVIGRHGSVWSWFETARQYDGPTPTL